MLHGKRGLSLLVALLLVAPALAAAQEPRPDRVPVDGRPLWLSGGNIAWVTYDINCREEHLRVYIHILKEHEILIDL